MHRDSSGSLTRNGDSEKEAKENGQNKLKKQSRQSNLSPPDPTPSTSTWSGRFYKAWTDPLRKAVSQNRRRLVCENFNLDLTYITDRIIAFGYPADDYEKLYRNTMEDTQRFLNRVHPGHYKVFNLRGKFFYDPQKFGGRVVSFEMMDHHPPRLEFMAQFCREAEHYLREDPLNVIAVHCKAGKGRTGVMICAYLVYINFYPKPRSIMDYYSIVRTTNNKGVTIPSQRRYIYYFHHLRQNQLNYMPLRVELVGIYLECPREQGSRDLGLRVHVGNARVLRGARISPEGGSWNQEFERFKGHRRDGPDSINFSENFYDNPREKNVISRRVYGWTVDPESRVFLEGDVRVDIYHESPVGKEKLGHVWFNTMFVCHGYCSTHYVHGDEQDRYEEDCTSISRRKESTNAAPISARADSAGVHDSDDKMVPSTSRSSSDSALRKKSKDEKKPWQAEYDLIEPPGLEKHCPESSLPSLHTVLKPPRARNREFLIDAHERGIVNDEYHERRGNLRREHATPPVAAAPERETLPKAGGPFFLRRKPNEHVQCFPTFEIDRAIKKGSLSDECKLIIVTRCINPDDLETQEIAAQFVEKCELEQRLKDKKAMEKERKLKVATEEIENMYCTPGAGIPTGDPRADDARMRKFFTRQRRDSVSRYPDANFRCPLLPGAPSVEANGPLAQPQTAVGPVEGVDCEAEELKKRCSSNSSDSTGSSSTSDDANGCCD